jgi:tRNA threonylcarbamoyl adenosine modification protein (Sua5/YciO/YrdC/YwlC family)
MILKINPQNPQKRLIQKVVQALQEGEIIGYPTDTFYGLGCDLFNKKAIQKIYQIKHRAPEKPFSFICADLKDISAYAQITNYAYKTMKRLLPGPYTVILEATKLVPKIMITKRKTVGIRVPDYPIVQSIVESLGHPIISTSASLPNGEILSDPTLIAETFGPRLHYVIDAGILISEPSTVISLIGDIPEVIRQGKGKIDFF